MADIRNVIVVGDGPVKDAPALHGSDIGYIFSYGNVQLSVDYARLDDGWVPIVNPPLWKETKKVGWVKWSRCAELQSGEVKILVTYYSDGRAPIAKVVG